MRKTTPIVINKVLKAQTPTYENFYAQYYTGIEARNAKQSEKQSNFSQLPDMEATSAVSQVEPGASTR